ncbi:MAG TPA: hypothetical protein VLA89_01830 [Gemmatimonadales bacterium]|nr:hypothetical protein [Gemmatimonadales bacterium]
MPRLGTADPGFITLLASYPKEVQNTARAARQLILELIPGAVEVVDTKTAVVGYGYGTGYKDLVCTLILSKGGVKLGLVGGASLPDPRKLLEGSGKVHRYVPLGRPADLRRPGLRPLLHATLSGWRRRSMAGR